ncbi:LIM and SH3 domain protein Lasp-like [Alosa sapidissima]|uniref:LIM and SH3 domain protein Lasp-like n=1 Tax=Alosa sapidissima TaxID=34773 RepID=UPI001C09EC6B|nr:LIM and SH3 domain protein Lasp-like [Alosa sapidissima]
MAAGQQELQQGLRRQQQQRRQQRRGFRPWRPGPGEQQQQQQQQQQWSRSASSAGPRLRELLHHHLVSVVLVGSSQHAVSALRLLLDVLEEVRRSEDAHTPGRGEAGTQPQQPGQSQHLFSQNHAVQIVIRFTICVEETWSDVLVGMAV